MQLYRVVLFGIVSAAAGTGAVNPDLAAQRKVTMCLVNTRDPYTLGPATELAKQIYARIGVRVDWRSTRSCPADSILVYLRDDTPDTLLPGALGYARPSDGMNVEIFCDRILKTVEPRLAPILLAHVLVHESAHILQGIARHSPTGMMKPRWNHTDYAQMAVGWLPFAPLDVTLIYEGMDRRASQITSSRP
jgi:hypothetical protein